MQTEILRAEILRAAGVGNLILRGWHDQLGGFKPDLVKGPREAKAGNSHRERSKSDPGRRTAEDHVV